MSIETYQALLKRFGEFAGLEGCVADEDGFCALEFDDDIVVHLQLDSDGAMITLSGDAGEIDEDYSSEIYTVLLEANAAYRTKNDLVFGLDPASGHVELYLKLPATVDLSEFEAALGGFVDELESWKAVVARQGQVFDALAADGADETQLEDDDAPPSNREEVIWG